MPDTFGKRQREADKVRRREAKDARRVARKTEAVEPTNEWSDAPPADPETEPSSEPGSERGEAGDDPS